MVITKGEGQNDPDIEKPERILVNLTPTGEWVGIVEYAVWLAGKFGARLYALDVIHDPFAYSGWNLPMPSFEKEYQQFVAEARERLRAVVEKEREKGFVIEPLIREGDPAEEIMKVIDENQIDVLVMPAHEEERIEHRLFGKVNDKILRKMPCTILLVREPIPGRFSRPSNFPGDPEALEGGSSVSTDFQPLWKRHAQSDSLPSGRAG